MYATLINDGGMELSWSSLGKVIRDRPRFLDFRNPLPCHKKFIYLTPSSGRGYPDTWSLCSIRLKQDPPLVIRPVNRRFILEDRP